MPAMESAGTQRPLGVPSTLESLRKRCEGLAEALVELERRLSGVLRIEPEAEDTPKVAELRKSRPQLVEDLDSIQDQVLRAVQIVRSMERRLDL